MLTEIHPTDLHVGERVRDRRKQLGMSQSDLSAALKLTFQQVQKYERGSNRVSASRLYQISKILKVSVSYFFEGLDRHDPDQPSTTETSVLGFLQTSEGGELAAYFPKLSPTVRRSIVNTVKAMAEER